MASIYADIVMLAELSLRRWIAWVADQPFAALQSYERGSMVITKNEPFEQVDRPPITADARRYTRYTVAAMAKVLISLDDALLARIDRSARAGGLTRSAYIAQLAERDAARTRLRSERMMNDAFETLDRMFKKAPPGDGTAEIREMRDAR